tara:strand:- start:22 stop:258 length:237 start_codon:yes stop_codon:yes gene_type:complete
MASSKKSPTSQLASVIDELEDLIESGVKFVPAQPSPAMTQAGARAGGIDEAQAAKIYRAMLEADAIEDPVFWPGTAMN